jgi:superfamily II DNA or RNA helicase
MVPRWRPLDLTLLDRREPHDYQVEALAAWDGARRLGSIVLPTGAGKTFVALQAIHRVNRSAVVVAPTIDLLHQWYARLANAFATEIGVYYGGEKQVQPITVTTYHSAGDLIAQVGNHFKLIIYDEVHHLPAPSWGETALMSPALHRLGQPPIPKRMNRSMGAGGVADLIGPIVYEKQLGELVGKQLAEYRTKRIQVDRPPERRRYDADYALYAAFWKAASCLRRPTVVSGADAPQCVRPSARVRCWRASGSSLWPVRRSWPCSTNCCVNTGRNGVDLHENNAVAYHLPPPDPAVTHETKAAERKQILEGFQAGTYQALVGEC